jgi:predicted NBD/HSP70 family sugar kinase
LEIKKDGHFSHHSLNDKERKNLTILELIRKKGPISRTEISHITDINMVSISKYIKTFLDLGLVGEKGFTESTGGRRQELVELDPKGAFVIGVDISSSQYSAVITDLDFKVVARKRTAKPSKKNDIHGVVETLVEELISSSGIDKNAIKAMGLGISGNDEGHQAREALEKRFGVSAYVATEAAAAAYGEKKLNPAADVEDMLYMHSDIGCGIIVMGDIYFGAGGNAGDMLSFNERIAEEEENTFFKGTQYLRPWCVDLGMIEAAKKEIERGIGTKMVALSGGDVEGITRQVVIEAARQNDEIALDIVKNVAVNLGIRIAYLVNIFDPEVVVIGGCIEKAGNLIMEPIQKEVRKFTVTRSSDQVKVIPSALGEDAVSMGAAALATREIFIKA